MFEMRYLDALESAVEPLGVLVRQAVEGPTTPLHHINTETWRERKKQNETQSDIVPINTVRETRTRRRV